MELNLAVVKGLNPERLVAWILMKINMEPDDLANRIGDDDGELDAVLNGARAIGQSFAASVGCHLDTDPNLLTDLHSQYNKRMEEVRSNAFFRPDLSKIRRILFWGTSLEKIDWVRQKRSVILRTFQPGNDMEKDGIIRFYGK